MLGKGRSDRLLVDIVLEAADADLPEMAPVLGVHLGGHLEPDRVEQFQQPGEADRLAVVRGGRGEEAVLEEEPDLPQHPGPLAGTASALRGEVMHFVHDQQIPGSMSRHPVAVGLGAGARPGRLEELPQHVGHAEVIHRRDDAGERLPGVRVDAQAASELEGRI